MLISDFVQVARNLFCLHLDEINVGVHEISSILDSQVEYAKFSLLIKRRVECCGVVYAPLSSFH